MHENYCLSQYININFYINVYVNDIYLSVYLSISI